MGRSSLVFYGHSRSSSSDDDHYTCNKIAFSNDIFRDFQSTPHCCPHRAAVVQLTINFQEGVVVLQSSPLLQILEFAKKRFPTQFRSVQCSSVQDDLSFHIQYELFVFDLKFSFCTPIWKSSTEEEIRSSVCVCVCVCVGVGGGGGGEAGR